MWDPWTRPQILGAVGSRPTLFGPLQVLVSVGHLQFTRRHFIFRLNCHADDAVLTD